MKSSDIFKSGAKLTCAALCTSSKLLYKGAKKAGTASKHYIETHPEEVAKVKKTAAYLAKSAAITAGHAAIGTVKETKELAQTMYTLQFSPSDEVLKERLEQQYAQYEHILASGIAAYSVYDAYSLLLDQNQVHEAYMLAYPHEAAQMTLEEKFASLSSDIAREGLLNGVKGKLFELKYCDYLNADNLPDGYHAALYDNPTHAATDIYITDKTGQIVEELQNKATESASYILQTLHDHPDIPVVTTEEVFAHAAMRDGNAIHSGISDIDLTNTVHANAAPDWHDLSIFPGATSLLFLAAMTFAIHKHESDAAKGEYIGRRYIRMIPSHLISGIAALALGGPAGLGIGMASSFGFSLFFNKKKEKARIIQQIQKQIAVNEQAIARLQTRTAK